jgi:hypothetical protein
VAEFWTPAGLTEQDTGLTAVLVIDGAQQPRQIGLTAVPVPPDLGGYHRVGAQLHPALLSHAQPGDHRAVVAVHGHQRPCVENQGAHAAVSSAATPSSRSALAISCAQRTMLGSQPARNSASASACS